MRQVQVFKIYPITIIFVNFRLFNKPIINPTDGLRIQLVLMTNLNNNYYH